MTITEKDLSLCSVHLSEDEKAVIDGKLQMIRAHIKEQPEVTVTYFQPDEKKSGGAYVTVTGFTRKIDEQRRLLILQNETIIHISEIIDIQELR